MCSRSAVRAIRVRQSMRCCEMAHVVCKDLFHFISKVCSCVRNIFLFFFNCDTARRSRIDISHVIAFSNQRIEKRSDELLQRRWRREVCRIWRRCWPPSPTKTTSSCSTISRTREKSSNNRHLWSAHFSCFLLRLFPLNGAGRQS